jgi:AcrR family transcriptional regulator
MPVSVTNTTKARAAIAGGPRVYGSARLIERGERILDVTRAMLSEHGYQGLTMREVAARAGVARKTLYDRFRSKDELVLAALREVLAGVEARASAAAQAGGIAAVLAYDVAVSRQIVRSPKYAAAMGHALFQADRKDELTDALVGAATRRHVAALEQAQAHGEIRPGVDIAGIAQHLSAQGWGLILFWMKGLLAVRHVEREIRRAHLMTLLAVTQGPCHESLGKSLAELQ